MAGDEDGATSAADAAARIGAQRAALVELLAELPETRLSKPTPRQGWTLRHELSWLAASDEELVHRLDPSLPSPASDAQWRRLRGEAMHTAQELRLSALREHLEASGARVSASLDAHSSRLSERGVRDAVDQHLGHASAAIEALRGVLAK